MNQLVFQRAPETFHGGIVIAVPFSAHGGFHVKPRKELPIISSTVLTPSVGMMDQPLGRPLDCHSLAQGLAHKLRDNSRPQGITHDLAVEEVLVGGTVESSFIGRDVGNIAHPRFVLLIEEVVRHRERVIRIRGSLELLYLFAPYAEFLPYPFDP